MIRFVAVTVLVLVAGAALMELIDLGLQAAGMEEETADLVSLGAVVLAAHRFVKHLPPDGPSLAWAAIRPTTAAVLAGACIAVLLSGYFFVTGDDTAVAAGASALAVLVGAGCAWGCRRDYARLSAG